MKWNTNDIDMYLKSKEYVDTAILPLAPIALGDQLKSAVAMGEYIHHITLELERQFKGRLLLLPAFTYLREEKEMTRIERLSQWSEALQQEFIHLFFLTSDLTWKQEEDKLSGTLLWLPSLPLEHVEANYKQEVIQDQIKQIIPLIMDKWKS